jgi:hypothetical protein
MAAVFRDRRLDDGLARIGGDHARAPRRGNGNRPPTQAPPRDSP